MKNKIRHLSKTPEKGAPEKDFQLNYWHDLSKCRPALLLVSLYI